MWDGSQFPKLFSFTSDSSDLRLGERTNLLPQDDWSSPRVSFFWEVEPAFTLTQSPQLQERAQVIPGPPHGLILDLWLLYLLAQVLPIRTC